MAAAAVNQGRPVFSLADSASWAVWQVDGAGEAQRGDWSTAEAAEVADLLDEQAALKLDEVAQRGAVAPEPPGWDSRSCVDLPLGDWVEQTAEPVERLGEADLELPLGGLEARFSVQLWGDWAEQTAEPGGHSGEADWAEPLDGLEARFSG